MVWTEVGAAWVQAIGSIVGIFVAVFLSWATIQAEKNRVVARARVVAFRLAPLLGTLHADIERALICADELEPGTNEFNTAGALMACMALPTEIPDEIFSETWTLPSKVALMVANLENALREYRIMSSQMNMAGSIGVISQESRTEILRGMRGTLRRIDTFALAVSNYCTAVAKSATEAT